MSALGTTALHLRIAEFKFTHNFIICNPLPETELIFGINIQKKFSLSYAWYKERNCYIQRDGKFLVYTHTCDCKATIGTVKSTLRIPPQHNGVVAIKIGGPIIETHMAYFLIDDSTPKKKIQTLTKLVAFIRSRARHLSTYLSLIIPINI